MVQLTAVGFSVCTPRSVSKRREIVIYDRENRCLDDGCSPRGDLYMGL